MKTDLRLATKRSASKIAFKAWDASDGLFPDWLLGHGYYCPGPCWVLQQFIAAAVYSSVWGNAKIDSAAELPGSEVESKCVYNEFVCNSPSARLSVIDWCLETWGESCVIMEYTKLLWYVRAVSFKCPNTTHREGHSKCSLLFYKSLSWCFWAALTSQFHHSYPNFLFYCLKVYMNAFTHSTF